MSNRSKPANGKLKMIQDHQRHRNERKKRDQERKKKQEIIEINLDDSEVQSVVSRSSSQYEVEEICGKRVIKGNVEYFIKWKNFDEKLNTWEKEDNLVYVKKWLDQYDQKESKKQVNQPKEEQRGKKLTSLVPAFHMKIGKVINQGFPPPPIVSPVSKASINLKANSSYDSLQSTPLESSKNHNESRQESMKSVASNSKSKPIEKIENRGKQLVTMYNNSKQVEMSNQNNTSSSKNNNSSSKNNILIENSPLSSKQQAELKKQKDHANNFYTNQELNSFVQQSKQLLQQLRIPKSTKSVVKPIFMYTDTSRSDPQGTDSWNSSLDFPNFTEKCNSVDQLRQMIERYGKWPSNYKMSF